MKINILTPPPVADLENGTRRCGRLILRSAVGAGAAAVLAVGLAGTASADTDTGSTNGHVEVSSSIVLSGLTPDFTLTGIPGATVEGVGAVTFNVQTNNLAGYAVTVQSRTATMVAAATGNTDSIPIGALSVRETGTTPYTAMTATAPGATVHTQATRSAQGGDALSNDYQVVIPFVNTDTYSATLDYVAATL